MRLINIRELRFKEFRDDKVPPYGIVSHRWGNDEVTYHAFEVRKQNDRPGSRRVQGYGKVLGCSEFVVRYRPDIEWMWIDSCCVDQTNPSELSRSINSMFQWYRRAAFCMAYLSDVRKDESWVMSEWFRRGWTLQELLAPTLVVFADRDWRIIGAKTSRGGANEASKFPERGAELLSLEQTISKITKVPIDVLRDFRAIRDVTFENRLKWMKDRKTTVPEDLIYSQLGLFDVSMPLLYGEGVAKAHRRLQEEIAKLMVRADQVPSWYSSQSSSTEPAGSISDNRMRAMIGQYQDHARENGLSVPGENLTTQQIHYLATNARERTIWIQRVRDMWRSEQEASEGESSGNESDEEEDSNDDDSD